jgi:3-oxoacyl-[acyl-carrier protein] reductase
MARTALVTGAGRRENIGYAVAERLRADGYEVLAHAFPEEPLLEPGLRADFADPAAPRAAVEHAIELFGALDVIVATHARSSDGISLRETTAEELDLTFAVNARASVLLTQAFAELHDPARADGRVILFTSGQHIGPMLGELPYVVSKGAIHQMTATLAAEVAELGITVNTVNPGPVDTGYAPPDVHARVAQAFPGGRWGRPEDIAAVVAFLASPESAWITGEIINAEGGFRRW